MKNFFLTVILVLVSVAVMAVPAKKGLWKTITLENGKEVKAQLKGDEFGHYWQAVDGHCYVSDGDIYQEQTPAIIQKAAQKRAKAQMHRTVRLPRKAANGAHRAPASHLGQKKGLILLVNFKDVKFQEENNQALYNNIANTPGYTDENGFKGSVSDYFKDQSHGQFELTFDVVGPVTVSKNASYYGKNDTNGDDMHAEEMVVEAVTLAKNMVSDWSQYDWDGDGEVDQVMIIYAGEGEADGGAASTIWPHEYALENINVGKVKVGDNLYVNTYAVANEGSMHSSYGMEYFAINGIGTICHEFSHCLGLMDMYDVGYSGYYGMNSWSLMDSGSYNGDGFVPAGYTSYDKYCIGWVTPTELTTELEVKGMRPLTNADDVYIIKNAAHSDEYYLLENRQKKGWDAEIPAQGMLILHVDYDPDIWFYNLVNSFSDGSDGYPKNDHQRCTILHADGKDLTAETYEKICEVMDKYYASTSDAEAEKYYEEYIDLWDQYNADVADDVYPQEGNNQLTNTSQPRAFLYNKNSDGRKLMNISITDITQNADGTISFKFAPDNSGSGEEGDNTQYSSNGANKPNIEGALFYESFDQCDGKGGNDGQWSGSIASGTFTPDNEGWTACKDSKGKEKSYGANQCAKFGSSDVAGSATTPAFVIDGTGKLTFMAGAWNAKNDGTTLNLTVSNGTISPSTVTMSKGSFTAFEATITATGNVQITFEAEKGRFFLDEVLVMDPNYETAISTVKPVAVMQKRIYTLDGRYVGSDYQQLGHGIYIVNGKKIVK